MPKRSHGPQQGCRNALRKTPRNKGKVSITKQLKEFEVGDKVLIKIEPTIKKNVIHRRFINKPGTVVERRGNAYRIRVNDLHKEKDVFVIPVHLRKL
jgi:large subunit ribosomal protein L21e